MPIRKELSLRLPNSPGAFAEVTTVLGDENVTILAAALEPGGLLRLVVDNHVRAASALRERHRKVDEHDVIVVNVPHTNGALASVLRLAADAGVNIEYAYASVGERADATSVVLGVEDAARAAAASGL
jgi:hypothetical protein